MSAVLADGNTSALRTYEREQADSYAAAEEIEDRRDSMVMDYLEKIAKQPAEIGDFLGGYVAADPQAMTALMSLIKLSGRPLGIEANREAIIQAATRFANLTMICADVQFGDWLVREELEK